MKQESQKTFTPNPLKSEILKCMDAPGELEKLYRKDKAFFKKEFTTLYPEIKESKTAQVWFERLKYESEGIHWGSSQHIFFLILAVLFSGLLAKYPHFAGIREDLFYARNFSFIVLPGLIFFFAWKNKLSVKQLAIMVCLILFSAIYINLLPMNEAGDTLVLACVHLPILLWAIFAYAFIGNAFDADQKRLDFLRFNGELLVMSAIMLICGGILTAVSFGLFGLIGMQIEAFFTRNILVFGLPAVPVLATYLVYSNPQLVKMISPVVAKIFAPLVLILLITFLGAVLYTGKDPYNDRDFLILFNVLLIGVMALIFFSVSTNVQNGSDGSGYYLLLALAVLTIIANGMALSAILFRISEWGWTPNRTAVFGSNVIILCHLLLVSSNLFLSLRQKMETGRTGRAISLYLPAYVVWAVVVTFLFPIVFGF